MAGVFDPNRWRTPPGHYFTSASLIRILVDDAAAYQATPLGWFVAACQRIAQLDRCSVETATRRVMAAIHEETGLTGATMPDTMPPELLDL